MKKYIPVDFDEKGNAVLGREKNTPTSNSFIPTTWAPGGSEGKQGVKSISISPAITTNPALDSVNVYWDDLTEEQKESGEVRLTIMCLQELGEMTEYTITMTPTDTWAIAVSDDYTVGEPASVSMHPIQIENALALQVQAEVFNPENSEEEFFMLTLFCVDDDPK